MLTSSRMLAMGVSPLAATLTESEHWQMLGMAGGVLTTRFDHEYYHAMATHAGTAPSTFNRLDCIDHFVQHGLANLCAVGPDLDFDVDFYAEELPQTLISQLAEGEDSERQIDVLLYQHFLSHGLRDDATPNLKAWVKQDYKLTMPDAFIAQLPVFRLVSNTLDTATVKDGIRYLFTHARPGVGALDLGTDELVDFVVDLADHYAVKGDQDQSEWLYWTALDQDPYQDRALRHLADSLQRKGETATVSALRARVSDADQSAWNFITQTENFMAASRPKDAAQTLLKMPASAFADVAIAEKYADLSRTMFFNLWHNISPNVKAYGIEETQDRLRITLDACSPTFTTAERSSKIKRIALVGNEDLYQCKLYRVDQKAEQLRAAGFVVEVFAPNTQLDNFRSRLREFHAAIFFRVSAFPPMINAISEAAQNGLVTFYEIDDVVFDTDHFPPPLESYADQITPALYAQMACGVPLFEHAMSLCDYGIAYTATIAELMKKKVRTGRIFEHHNALSRLHLFAQNAGPAPKPDRAPLVVFYGSGTRAHKEDFHDILEPALAEMVKRHGSKIEIRLIGHFGEFKHLNMESDPVTLMEPVWDFEEFMSRVADADINLSVLAPSLLTDAKSEIKWMEAGMFKIPSIVSDTATHREVIEHDVTGYLAQTTNDFIANLDLLITNAAQREKIGQAAYDKIVNTYGLDAMGANLRNVFEQIRPPHVRKKRLVVVNVFYPPQAIGGATRVVHDNVTQLRERYGDEFEIDVICTREGGQTPFDLNTYSNDGVRVWAITTPPHPMGDMGNYSNGVADVFEQVIAKLDPDLIHFHCIQRLTTAIVDVARYRNIPYVITLHDGWWISPNQFILGKNDEASLYDYADAERLNLPVRAQSLRRSLAAAEYLLAVSQSFADLHEACNLTNVAVVENGVSALPTATHTKSTSGRVRLAHIGGASRHKGIHLVRNALYSNSYDNLELLLIGHAMSPGSSRHEIWGSTPVTIEGKVPQSEIAALYGRVDILLAPSIWPESYGLVTREAKAMETWVIPGGQGAIGADVAEDVNGYVIDISTYEGLADILTKIDHDPQRYLDPPKVSDGQRTSQDQTDDLATLYREILAET